MGSRTSARSLDAIRESRITPPTPVRPRVSSHAHLFVRCRFRLCVDAPWCGPGSVGSASMAVANLKSRAGNGNGDRVVGRPHRSREIGVGSPMRVVALAGPRTPPAPAALRPVACLAIIDQVRPREGHHVVLTPSRLGLVVEHLVEQVHRTRIVEPSQRRQELRSRPITPSGLPNCGSQAPSPDDCDSEQTAQVIRSIQGAPEPEQPRIPSSRVLVWVDERSRPTRQGPDRRVLFEPIVHAQPKFFRPVPRDRVWHRSEGPVTRPFCRPVWYGNWYRTEAADWYKMVRS
jgi:hypothetical protein